ncbi:MAG: rhodanese-like domain-containing protein, partial [Gaiellaceae bacterium]
MSALVEVVAANGVLDPVISTAELHRQLCDPDLALVDVRPLPAYNGWRLAGEARGGHIPGAVAFPAAWLVELEEPEVRRLLEAKAVVPGREVVVYGDGREDVSAAAASLAKLGQ